MINQRGQRKVPIKYIVSTSILGFILLVGIILGCTTRTTLMELWNTRYMTGIIWYIVYVDAFFLAVTGAFIPSLISLRYDIRLGKKIKWLLLVICIVAILLYLYLGAWMTFAGFALPRFLMPLVRNPTFIILHLVIPFLFGMFVFLGIN